MLANVGIMRFGNGKAHFLFSPTECIRSFIRQKTVGCFSKPSLQKNQTKESIKSADGRVHQVLAPSKVHPWNCFVGTGNAILLFNWANQFTANRAQTQSQSERDHSFSARVAPKEKKGKKSAFNEANQTRHVETVEGRLPGQLKKGDLSLYKRNTSFDRPFGDSQKSKVYKIKRLIQQSSFSKQ